MAQLTGMTLIKNGMHVDQMINFGAPRIGDDKYSAFSDTKFPNSYRMVHHQDIVPHNPGESWPLNFYHSSTEIYYDTVGNYRTCGKGEDKTCADQWQPWAFSLPDHLNYMGKCMGEYCGNCKSSNENLPPSDYSFEDAFDFELQ